MSDPRLAVFFDAVRRLALANDLSSYVVSGAVGLGGGAYTIGCAWAGPNTKVYEIKDAIAEDVTPSTSRPLRARTKGQKR